jgi:hypothetical protein
LSDGLRAAAKRDREARAALDALSQIDSPQRIHFQAIPQFEYCVEFSDRAIAYSCS